MGKKLNKQDKLHESNRYKDMAFPVGMYTVTIDGIEPEGRGYLDLHWHEELQYTVILSGTVNMQVNGDDYLLSEGQGILINKNLLHITNELSEDGKYYSINSHDNLLGFYIGSRMELDNVRPYTNNLLFPVIVLEPQNGWQANILNKLALIREELMDCLDLYQYRVALLLTEAWYEVISHIGKVSQPTAAYIRKQERMQKMLSFIHERYSDAIFLDDIAMSAGVSTGECCRCFRETIHESPNQYLIKYRISRASELLTITDLSVTEIALECGFNDTSHFIDYFRKRIGKTPFEFRNRRD